MALAPAERDYRFSPQEGRRPLLDEVKAWGEFLALQASPIYYGFGVPHGDKSPVMVLPGFMGADDYLMPINFYLTRINYRIYPAGFIPPFHRHTDPEREVERLIPQIKDIHRQQGKKIHLVCHSLGGILGRVLAMEIPESISSITALGSPVDGNFEQEVNPFVFGLAKVTIPILRKPEELAKRREQLSQPLPENVKSTYIHTKDDAVVDWRATIDKDPHTENIEVDGTHSGLVVNISVYQILARILVNATKAEEEAEPRRANIAVFPASSKPAA